MKKLNGPALLERIAEVVHSAAEEHKHDDGVDQLCSQADPTHVIKTCFGCGAIAEQVTNLLIIEGLATKRAAK